MKKDLTEIVFILDRSGSMSGLEGDTIGGFNAMLKKQKDEIGEAIISTILFDHHFEVLHDRLNIKDVPAITDQEYFTRGTTALLDAIGKSIIHIKNVQRKITNEEKPEKTLFIITTDGFENASQEFSYRVVKDLIESAKSNLGWDFLFMGANIDAAKEASKFGITQDYSANYHPDSVGTKKVYEAMNMSISNLRAKKTIKDDWKANLDQDYKKRK